jgi:hypothetical protein
MSDSGSWTDLPPVDYGTGGYTELPWDPGQVDVTAAQTIPYDTSSSDGFNTDNALKLLTAGVNAYGQIENINHGGYSAYGAPPPPAPYHAPVPYSSSTPQPGVDAPAGFDWSQLTDFSTPYPYAVGLVTLAGVVMIARSVSRR